MFENTFEYKQIEREGGVFHLLTALEHPWLNIQVITFDEADHDDAIAKLKASGKYGWIIEQPGRRDFAVVHAGGSARLHFTQENVEQLCEDMRQCLRNAAQWWADLHPVNKNQNQLI